MPQPPKPPSPPPAAPDTPVHTPDRLHAEEVGGADVLHAPVGDRRGGGVTPDLVLERVVVGEPTAVATPAAVAAAAGRGWLVAIGGRMEHPEIITRFVELCGGGGGHIVIVPTASNQPDTGSWYARVLGGHGAGQVSTLRLQRRGDHVSTEQLDLVQHATGVFFTGGNQLKLATSIIGTPLARLLHERFARGMHVAGTSAGAAFLSAHMIAFGEEGADPHAGMVITCGGLGLTERFIIDQHFRERGRLGRLLTAVAYNPFVMGLGVDENTAIFISPHDELNVMGEGAVTIVDPAQLDTSPLYEALPGTKLDLEGMKVRMLCTGERLALM